MFPFGSEDEGNDHDLFVDATAIDLVDDTTLPSLAEETDQDDLVDDTTLPSPDEETDQDDLVDATTLPSLAEETDQDDLVDDTTLPSPSEEMNNFKEKMEALYDNVDKTLKLTKSALAGE